MAWKGLQASLEGWWSKGVGFTTEFSHSGAKDLSESPSMSCLEPLHANKIIVVLLAGIFH